MNIWRGIPVYGWIALATLWAFNLFFAIIAPSWWTIGWTVAFPPMIFGVYYLGRASR